MQRFEGGSNTAKEIIRPPVTDGAEHGFPGEESDVDIYMTEKTAIDAIRAYMAGQLDHLEEDRVRFRLMTDKTAFDDGRLRVTPFPTRHLAGQGRPAYSFLVEAEGKSILFSGDLSGRLAENDFPRYALDHSVDLMICEMAHFGIDEVSPYLERCRAKTLLFNHVFPLGKLEGIAALDMKWGYPIRAVADGDEIVL